MYVLNITHEMYFYSTVVMIMLVFQRLSMNFNMSVGQAACRLTCHILKARWLRPAFAESYQLLRVTLSKELVAVHV